MISSRSIKRDAAPENAKPIKNATRAAVDVRTRATCRSKGSSAERISEPSQKPSSWTATTPAIRPNATSSSVIRGPLSQSHALYLVPGRQGLCFGGGQKKSSKVLNDGPTGNVRTLCQRPLCRRKILPTPGALAVADDRSRAIAQDATE